MMCALKFSCLAAALCLAVPAAQAEPAMWVVKDADSTIYLLGTVHALRPEVVWNSKKVTDSLAKSTELWIETLDADQAKVAPLMQRYGLDAKKPLSKKLNAKQKAKLKKVAVEFGFPLTALESMKPWLAALTLTVRQITKAGYDPEAGVEQILQAQAKKEGDKVRGLETFEEQVRFFADLAEAEQVAFLEQTLDHAEEGIALLDTIAKAWAEGDTETIGRIMVDELKTESPKLYGKLLVQRNKRWAGQIEKMLRGAGVHQIAVGAGHLAGPDSVQVQLARRGIQAEPF